MSIIIQVSLCSEKLSIITFEKIPLQVPNYLTLMLDTFDRHKCVVSYLKSNLLNKL